MQRRESKFALLFRHWIKANPPRVTTHYELKQTTSDRLRWSAFEKHQEVYGVALQTSDKGVLIRNIGGNGEPDYTYSYKEPVCIVVRFPKFFCIIPLSVFTAVRERTKEKSLTSEIAQAIATQVVRL